MSARFSVDPNMKSLFGDYCETVGAAESDLASMFIDEHHTIIEGIDRYTLAELTAVPRQTFPEYITSRHGATITYRTSSEITDMFVDFSARFERTVPWIARMVFHHGFASEIVANNFLVPPILVTGPAPIGRPRIGRGLFYAAGDFCTVFKDFQQYMEAPSVTQLTGTYITEVAPELENLSLEDCQRLVADAYRGHDSLIAPTSIIASLSYVVPLETWNTLQALSLRLGKSLSWVTRTTTQLGLARAMAEEHFTPGLN